MHFDSFWARLLELLGVRMSPKSEQKSMHKLASTKEAPKSEGIFRARRPEGPAGGDGVTPSP